MEVSVNLPDAAVSAWEAYLAMEKSKQRHLNYLKELAERHGDGSSRTIPESVFLDKLLNAHDQQVKLFRKEMADLVRTDLAAHSQLIDYIKAFNESLGTDERPH